MDGTISANRIPNPPPIPPTRIRAALISGISLPGWRGISPINSVPHPNMAILASSVIAEIAAEDRPTASGGKYLAASHQYGNPSTNVMAVVPANDPVLANMAL
jgi:hypothetical protein